jgi:DNA mismatch endonuclease, patch repair protein
MLISLWYYGLGLGLGGLVVKALEAKKGISATWLIGIPLKEEHKQKLRERRWHRVFPKRDTLPEKIAQQALTELGIEYITHRGIVGQPDIFIKPNICIFIDGCYWHNCPIHHPEAHWKKREYDWKITSELQNQGYYVLRIWEHELV